MGGCVCVFLHSNTGIQELPPELGQLANLWQLDIEELNIVNLPTEIRKEGEPVSFLWFIKVRFLISEII